MANQLSTKEIATTTFSLIKKQTEQNTRRGQRGLPKSTYTVRASAGRNEFSQTHGVNAFNNPASTPSLYGLRSSSTHLSRCEDLFNYLEIRKI